MARRTRFAVGGGLLVVALAVVLPAAVMAGPDNTASVQFGNPGVGSPFRVGPPPPPLHDESPNAQFNLVPGTVVVGAGGAVTFTVGVAGSTGNNIVPHQVAVCALGIGPDDVDVPATGTFINDPDCPTWGAPSTTGVQVTVPFSEPGRYLVLCNLRPHFVEFNMYGWVNVN